MNQAMSNVEYRVSPAQSELLDRMAFWRQELLEHLDDQ